MKRGLDGRSTCMREAAELGSQHGWVEITDTPAEGQMLLHEEQAEAEGWVALRGTPSP